MKGYIRPLLAGLTLSVVGALAGCTTVGKTTDFDANYSGTASTTRPIATATKARTDNSAGAALSEIGDVVSLKMINANDGWVASNTGVYHTSDGGHHWVRVLRGDAAFKTNGQTYFLDRNTAYAILPITNTTSHLFVTHDGGQHWQRSVVKFGSQTILQTNFPNSREGWIMTAPGGAAGPAEPVAIYKTTDGGLHTQLIVPAPTQSMSSHGLPQGSLKLGIYFSSPTQGWITGDSWGNDIWLYGTTNGGLTWKKHSIVSIPPSLKRYLGGDQVPGNPVFFNSTQGVLPVEFTGGGFCLYRTSDGGRHWRYTKPLLTKNGVEYDITDAKHVFAAVGETLYESNNLGLSWSVMSNSPPANATLDFVNSSVGYAVGSSLWKTMNGGRTWATIR